MIFIQTVVYLDLQLLAPVPYEGDIICIGINYREHAAESNVGLE